MQGPVGVAGDFVSLIIVVKQKRKAEEGELVIVRRKNIAITVGDLDCAAADHIDGIFSAAQLAVGIKFDGDSALRLCFHIFLECLKASVDRAVDDLIMGDDHLISFGTVVSGVAVVLAAAGSQGKEHTERECKCQ